MQDFRNFLYTIPQLYTLTETLNFQPQTLSSKSVKYCFEVADLFFEINLRGKFCYQLTVYWTLLTFIIFQLLPFYSFADKQTRQIFIPVCLKGLPALLYAAADTVADGGVSTNTLHLIGGLLKSC